MVSYYKTEDVYQILKKIGQKNATTRSKTWTNSTRCITTGLGSIHIFGSGSYFVGYPNSFQLIFTNNYMTETLSSRFVLCLY